MLYHILWLYLARTSVSHHLVYCCVLGGWGGNTKTLFLFDDTTQETSTVYCCVLCTVVITCLLSCDFSAPNGPPQSFVVIPRTGARNVTFSWSPPAPTLRNGIITGYSLSCVAEGGVESTVSMWYSQSGTFALEGFAPATTYNCSISASNSRGSGPVTYVVVTTMDDGKHVETM